jgi:hypothetical protein
VSWHWGKWRARRRVRQFLDWPLLHQPSVYISPLDRIRSNLFRQILRERQLLTLAFRLE